jgi:hypothetical protein
VRRRGRELNEGRVKALQAFSAPVRSRDSQLRAQSVGAGAIGAMAFGALAIGALAIGAIAIGALAIGRTRVRRLEVDELVVRRLRIIEETRSTRNETDESEYAPEADASFNER